MKLTKKRLANLDLALTLDDILYEKFRRMNDALSLRQEKFNARRQIGAVYQLKDGIQHCLSIERCYETPAGIAIVTR